MSAINTITSVMGINLDTLRPEPCGERRRTLLASAPAQPSMPGVSGSSLARP